jgi:hypothetical protein
VHQGESLHLQVEIEPPQRQTGTLSLASESEPTLPRLRVQLCDFQTIARTDQVYLDILVPYTSCRQLYHAIVKPQGPIDLRLLQRTSQTEVEVQLASALLHGGDERFEYLHINVGSLKL